jgi:hypothetical protein
MIMKDPAKLLQGFDYIKNEQKRLKLTDIDNRLTIWTELEIARDESPIYGWQSGLVERSIRNHSKKVLAAKTITNFHLTLKSFRPDHLRDNVAPLIGSHEKKAFLLLGEGGIGKSSEGKAWARLFSFYHIVRNSLPGPPRFRSANSFEHFRHEEGILERSEVHDDGNLPTEQIQKVKTYGDNGEMESMTVERWTANVFPRGSGRLLIANPYDIT